MLPLINKMASNRVILRFCAIVIFVIAVVVMINLFNKETDYDPLCESNFPSIRIMVQNGCGFSGVAQNVRTSLSSQNIDVVGVSNSRRFIYDETLIIVKHDDAVDLERLKRMTGIKNVIYAINENYFVSFIVIAGLDYQDFFK